MATIRLQKTPQTGYCYPWKEVRTTCFLFLCREGEFSFARTAVQILVCAPLAYRLLRSPTLRKVSERWQRSKNARHKAVARRARALCSPHASGRRWRARSPPRRPQTAKRSPRPFSFCQAFSFGPTWAKEKAEVRSFDIYAAAHKVSLVGTGVRDGLRPCHTA